MPVILFIYTGNIFSQVSHSVSFSKDAIHFSIFKSDSGDEYQTIQMDQLNTINDEVGAPEMPVKIIKLIIPADQEVSNIEITTGNKEIIKLQKLLIPHQYDIPTSKDYKNKAFVKPDQKYYGSDNSYPEKLVKIINSGYFDGANHIVTIAVYPFDYLPKQSELEFYSNINFSLKLISGGMKAVLANNRSDAKQAHIDDLLKNMVDNPEAIPSF